MMMTIDTKDVRRVLTEHLVDALKDKTSEISTIAFILQVSLEKLEELEAAQKNDEV